MNANKSWSSIGEEIRDAVESALRTGNFKDLGDVVTDTVKDVSAKVGQAVSDGLGGSGNLTEQYESATRERKRAQAQQEEARRREASAAAAGRAPFVRVGRISGTLYQVFGALGTGVMAVLSAVFLGLGIGLGGGWMVTFFILALVLLGFIGMLRVGCGQKLRLKRAKKYLELSGHNHYINLEELALRTGKAEKFVLKDVKKMLHLGYFPEGHLDRQETCLMLDDKIYEEYLNLEKQKRLQAQEQQESRAAQQEEQAPSGEKSELEAMISEGQECIRRLRNMNDNIPGEEISAKLFRLENLLKEIFEGLRVHPEQLPQMRKFMNYYLPTTLKLVSAYEEFEDLSSQSGEILEAKTEIEKTLDSINSAFEELLGRMFRDTAYDVTTDAQVLQTMLAKEGLTGQREFEKIPR